MSTIIQAPYPKIKVTSTFPNVKFGDIRKSESTITIKRTMTGRKITYVHPSDRYTLTLPFQLTRVKALEMEEMVNIYQAAHWKLTLYDGSEWDAQLVDAPVSRTATGRIGDNTLVGKELVELTLTLSAKRLN